MGVSRIGRVECRWAEDRKRIVVVVTRMKEVEGDGGMLWMEE